MKAPARHYTAKQIADSIAGLRASANRTNALGPCFLPTSSTSYEGVGGRGVEGRVREHVDFVSAVAEGWGTMYDKTDHRSFSRQETKKVRIARFYNPIRFVAASGQDDNCDATVSQLTNTETQHCNVLPFNASTLFPLECVESGLGGAPWVRGWPREDGEPPRMSCVKAAIAGWASKGKEWLEMNLVQRVEARCRRLKHLYTISESALSFEVGVPALGNTDSVDVQLNSDFEAFETEQFENQDFRLLMMLMRVV